MPGVAGPTYESSLAAARKTDVYICGKRLIARQATCGQIRPVRYSARGANQGRGRTSGDEKIFYRAGRNGQLRSIPKTPLAAGREGFPPELFRGLSARHKHLPGALPRS